MQAGKLAPSVAVARTWMRVKSAVADRLAVETMAIE
jgi:hypothetical protein